MTRAETGDYFRSFGFYVSRLPCLENVAESATPKMLDSKVNDAEKPNEVFGIQD